MKLITSEKADAEVIGHVILLFITILGLSMIVLYGVPAIYSLRDMANIKNVEQTFTVLDSRASRVVLGESPLQITNINLGSGSLTVVPNSTNTKSYMVIKSKNDIFNITIPMGKIKYTLGDRTVAYEGGGVWSKYPGGSVMLSPPEFHFNGVTLTLPVITISGNTSTGGTGSAAITFMKAQTLVLYPNASFKNRTNPINYTNTGKVYVNITSDYYDAWADFAESLLYTKVSTNTKNRTTSIELTVVPSTMGGPVDITQPINFRGVPNVDTPLDNFSFKIWTQNIMGPKWDIRAKSGNRTLIFSFENLKSPPVKLSIGYLDTTYSTTGETWGTAYYPNQEGETPVNVDLLNKSTYLNYLNINNIGADNSAACNAYASQFSGIKEPDYSWDNLVINTTNANKTQSLYNITEHYISKMAEIGDITFGQCAPGNKFPGTGSAMQYSYNTTGGITYLQITQNNANVTIR